MKRMYRRRIPRRSLELKFEDSAGCWKTLRETRAEKKGRVVIRKDKFGDFCQSSDMKQKLCQKDEKKKILVSLFHHFVQFFVTFVSHNKIFCHITLKHSVFIIFRFWVWKLLPSVSIFRVEDLPFCSEEMEHVPLNYPWIYTRLHSVTLHKMMIFTFSLCSSIIMKDTPIFNSKKNYTSGFIGRVWKGKILNWMTASISWT